MVGKNLPYGEQHSNEVVGKISLDEVVEKNPLEKTSLRKPPQKWRFPQTASFLEKDSSLPLKKEKEGVGGEAHYKPNACLISSNKSSTSSSPTLSRTVVSKTSMLAR